MEILFMILSLLIAFLLCITIMFWKKQKLLKKKSIVHRGKKLSKFELIEVSSDDEHYNEYYEPQIVEVLPNEEQ